MHALSTFHLPKVSALHLTSAGSGPHTPSSMHIVLFGPVSVPKEQ